MNKCCERAVRPFTNLRENYGGFSSKVEAVVVVIYITFVETCKLNDIDFGIYIEDVLTRIMYGEHVYDTFLPCGYVPRYKEGQDAA